jgi:uncharacterized protein involved in tellurium resistance
MWNFLRPAGAAYFDTGSANAVELTKRRGTVSLTKHGGDRGNLRINLSWSMRASDTAFDRKSKPWLRRQLDLFKPEPVQAAGPALVNVDLDIGCLYELADGSKGVVQPLGDLHGDLEAPPYIQVMGDDRFGSGSGETLYINLDHKDQFKRLLVFAYIYDGTPAFDRAHAKIDIYPSAGPGIEIHLDEREPQARSCAIVLLENKKGELLVRREVRYVYGFQAELDRLYGWGMQWGRGYKSKV